LYIIKVLEKGEFTEYALAGKFARKERAEGAMTALERLGETRPMKVELVNPGVQGNKGRTEHGAALASTPRKVTDPARLADLRVSIANARAAKAAKKNGAVKEEVVVRLGDARRDEVILTQDQVAQLVGSIRPGKPGSGEYILDSSALRPVAGKTGT
jgi:hypothetical protein